MATPVWEAQNMSSSFRKKPEKTGKARCQFQFRTREKTGQEECEKNLINEKFNK